MKQNSHFVSISYGESEAVSRSQITVVKGETMQTEITIYDFPCGSGKTTGMIEGFQEHQKYLVILPLLSEVERVINSSKKIYFSQPYENDNEAGTKEASLENMLLSGQNIATTHSLFQRLVPMIRKGLLQDYDIIIDEVPDVVKTVTSKSETSVDEFYIKTGYITVDQASGLVKPTQKWRSMKNDVDDTLSNQILKFANTGCLYLLDGQLFIWAMPRELLLAGRTITIMTYMFQGSILASYLCKAKVPFMVANDNSKEESFRKNARELINVQNIPAISKLKLSYSGQMSGMSNEDYIRSMVNGLKNLRGRHLKDISAQNILITCAKDGWYKNGSLENAGSFASGSKLFQGANWIPNTTRGTNDYMHCSHLIYLYDQHVNPVLARWLEDSTKAFNDAYALTELIQWVWRSRVRLGEPITLYLPSPRMRKLFEDWLVS